MRGLLVVAASVAATLVPAAPATTGSTGGPAPDDRSAFPSERAVPLPSPPGPFDRSPAEGCTVPVGTGLEACPPPRHRQPLVSCVQPLGLPPGGGVVPDCPRYRPAPEGRVVPVVPVTP